MTIVKNANGTVLTLVLTGRLDTITSPELEAELRASLSGVTELHLDFVGLGIFHPRVCAYFWGPRR